MMFFTVLFVMVLLLAVGWAIKGMLDDRRAGIPWRVDPQDSDVSFSATHDSAVTSHDAADLGGCDSGGHDMGGPCGGDAGGHH